LNLSHTISKLFSGEEPEIPGALTNFTTIQEKQSSWRVVYTADIITDESPLCHCELDACFPAVVVKYDVSPLAGPGEHRRAPLRIPGARSGCVCPNEAQVLD
jgi:hypothetical protein